MQIRNPGFYPDAEDGGLFFVHPVCKWRKQVLSYILAFWEVRAVKT